MLVVVSVLSFAAKTMAETMYGSMYSIEASRVGTGEISLPYAQSENYLTQTFDTSEEEDSSEEDDDDGGGGGKKKKKKTVATGATVGTGAGTVVTTEETAEEQKESTLPGKLFDINLEIDDATIPGISQLSARVIFTSFGTELTPVDLTFDILDSSGKIVRTEKDRVEVQTELIFSKKFSGFDLSEGKYTLRLTTLYNVDVRDEFTADFEIIKQSSGSKLWIWIMLGALGATLIIVIAKRRKDKEKDQI